MAKTTKTGVLTTPTAKATTVLEDSSPVLPLPDTPQGVMAVGPRVTFHFVQDYNQANSYDYYDVVNVDGTSYIAIQDVPANTPVTDTGYWVLWNDPNAQFAQLQGTVESFDNRITANASGLAQEASDRESDVSRLEGNIASNTSAIEDEQTFAIYLGNSWSYGVGSKSGNNGLFNRTKDMFTDAKLYQTSGGAIAAFEGHSSSFQTLLTTAVTDPEIDKSKVTHIICMCAIGEANSFSIDDQNYFTNTTNALNAMKSLAEDNFPNLKHCIVINCEARKRQIIPNGGGISGHTTDLWHTILLNSVLKAVCRNTTWEYGGWVGSYVIMNSSCFGDDNIHMNEVGYNILTPYVKQAITGYVKPNPLEVNMFTTSSLLTRSSGQVICMYDDGIWYVLGTLRNVTGSPAFTANTTQVQIYTPFRPQTAFSFNPPQFTSHQIMKLTAPDGTSVSFISTSYEVDDATGLLKTTLTALNGASSNAFTGMIQLEWGPFPDYGYNTNVAGPTSA